MYTSQVEQNTGEGGLCSCHVIHLLMWEILPHETEGTGTGVFDTPKGGVSVFK